MLGPVGLGLLNLGPSMLRDPPPPTRGGVFMVGGVPRLAGVSHDSSAIDHKGGSTAEGRAFEGGVLRPHRSSGRQRGGEVDRER